MQVPAMDMPTCQPHDLLWVAPGAIRLDGAWPAWADAEWLRRAPVVVRREAVAGGLLPVGLRGANRSERARAYVPAGAVTRRVVPEALAAGAAAALDGSAALHAAAPVPGTAAGTGGGVPAAAPAALQASPATAWSALVALAMAAPVLDAVGLAWGPTGGAGFFLACGLPVLRPDSDLDVLVRAPQPLTAAQAAALDGIQAGAPCRIDIQVDTGHGAFALTEWRRGGRVMLKTNAGPRLCADPWMES
jgi:phosphoribosyl-dephospho-CoA transferase